VLGTYLYALDYPANSQWRWKTLNNVLTYKTQCVNTNKYGIPTGTRPSPSRIWIMAGANDDKGPLNGKQNKLDPTDHHGAAGDNVAFCDGHSEWIGPDKKYGYAFQLSQDKPNGGP
jgi:prepilin-type processing-associated H-X9-DG protein